METQEIGKQIADLLNLHNDLVEEFRPVNPSRYLYIIEKDIVIGATRVEKMCWFMSLSRHTVTHPDHRSKGVGYRLLGMAEDKARGYGSQVIVGTVKVSNNSAARMLHRRGWYKVQNFTNSHTSHELAVWMKNL